MTAAAPRARCYLERPPNEASPLRILPRGGLVQHQESRPRGERRGDGQASLQLRREIARVLALAPIEADHCERLPGLRERIRRRGAERARTEHGFFENRAREKLSPRILKDETDEACTLVHRHRGEVRRATLDAPRSRGDEPHDRSGERALSRRHSSRSRRRLLLRRWRARDPRARCARRSRR